MSNNLPKQKVLATDLDGTLIPLQGSDVNCSDLQSLAESLDKHRVRLVFVTGRNMASVQEAIVEFQLPLPQFVICDVGTSMFQRTTAGDFNFVQSYADALQTIMNNQSMAEIRGKLDALKLDGLRVQEDEKQGPFKLSFYSTPELLAEHTSKIEDKLEEVDANVRVISSVDPFNNDGLIDLLPTGVSKAFALRWWCDFNRVNEPDVVFSGDSGNDLAAMVAGFRTIVVGNAADTLKETVRSAHQKNGWPDRLCIAKNEATSGVLEGCNAFGILS